MLIRARKGLEEIGAHKNVRLNMRLLTFLKLASGPDGRECKANFMRV